MKNNKGFSLVELIIVIAIMAVLVGVLAPTYLQYVEKSKKSNDVSTVDSIVNAVEIGAIDPEVMTDSTTSLTIVITNSSFNIKPATGSAWAEAVKAAVGTDIKLKSSNWSKKNTITNADEGAENTVVIVATRDVATGKVAFTYGADGTTTTAGSFKSYATSLTKIS